jgi:hypothetical protein
MMRENITVKEAIKSFEKFQVELYGYIKFKVRKECYLYSIDVMTKPAFFYDSNFIQDKQNRKKTQKLIRTKIGNLSHEDLCNYMEKFIEKHKSQLELADD